jgi:hypothetical protein
MHTTSRTGGRFPRRKQPGKSGHYRFCLMSNEAKQEKPVAGSDNWGGTTGLASAEEALSSKNSSLRNYSRPFNITGGGEHFFDLSNLPDSNCFFVLQ